MDQYHPFLKLKKNEILALKDLSKEVRSVIKPVFDVARPDEPSSKTIQSSINSGIADLLRHWDKGQQFYIDCRDLPTVSIESVHMNHYLLGRLNQEGFNFIPIFGLNREESHNTSSAEFFRDYELDILAIRLEYDDIQDFELIEDEIIDIIDKCESATEAHLLIDMRFIPDKITFTERASAINEFISDLEESHIAFVNKLIVTGSTIAANANHHTKPGEETVTERLEKLLYLEVKEDHPEVFYGDYGIVSPEYSDADISPDLFQNVMTPKVCYTGEDVYYIFRGKNFKVHPRKRKQYFDIAKRVVALDEYRGPKYSDGDGFIYEKSKEIDSPSSQGNWYRMLNNAHFTFIVNSILEDRL